MIKDKYKKSAIKRKKEWNIENIHDYNLIFTNGLNFSITIITSSQLWSRVVVPDRILSMGQIELFVKCILYTSNYSE